MQQRSSTTKMHSENIESSRVVIEVIEKKVLPHLQSGEETHLVMAQKRPRVVTLPTLPGVAMRTNSTPAPVIHKPAVRNRCHEESLMGFIYVIRGDVDFLLSHHTVSCHAGNFVFFSPYTWNDHGTNMLRKESAATTKSEVLWLYLKPQEILCPTGYLPHAERIGGGFLFIPDNHAFTLAEQLQEEVDSPIISQIATQLLWIIYDRLRRKLHEGNFYARLHSMQEISNTGNQQKLESIGERAQRYVDANLMRTQMTLENVARAIFTSRSRLAHEFPLHTGETLGTYLLRRRIELAQVLLTTSSMSIKEVAWRAGFTHADYFSATFHRITGSTPTQFRKRDDN